MLTSTYYIIIWTNKFCYNSHKGEKEQFLKVLSLISIIYKFYLIITQIYLYKYNFFSNIINFVEIYNK